MIVAWLVLLVATILLGCAAFGARPLHPRISYGWLALFIVALHQLLTTIPAGIS